MPLNTKCGKSNNLEQNSRKHQDNEFGVVRSHMQHTSGNDFRSVLTPGNSLFGLEEGAACLESAGS